MSATYVHSTGLKLPTFPKISHLLPTCFSKISRKLPVPRGETFALFSNSSRGVYYTLISFFRDFLISYQLKAATALSILFSFHVYSGIFWYFFYVFWYIL